MSTGRDAPVDPRFAGLDANATIDLCSSLADYGEAGGLSRDLMMQVGLYAESRYGDDLEVLLAAARMYVLGGEAERARSALVRAGQLGVDQARVMPLLDNVLKLLDDPRTAEQAVRDAPSDPPFHSPPPPPDSEARAARRRWAATTPRGVVSSPRPAATTPRVRPSDEALRAFSPFPREAFPMGETPKPPPQASEPKPPGPGPNQSYTPTTPMMRLPGHGPSRPTMPIARQGHPTPPPAGLRGAALAAASEPHGRAVTRGDSDRVPQARPVHTEIARRASRPSSAEGRASGEPSSPPPVSGPSPASSDPPARSGPPAPASGPVRPRIRILEPDDDRRKLDPYELIGEVASGGMATVYLGRLAGVGGFSRFVAIKQLHPHLAREEQFVQMFLDEARLAAGIHNAHVVPILEVGMSKSGYFLVMEFIEGDTLAGLTTRAASRGGLPAPVAVRVVLDALAGLHAAHQLTDAEGVHLGLVHRDCTPQNILVGIDGSARLTDFGVARAASRLAITRPQQVKGKVAYLSPEQAHAMDLDRRSDVFTMGIVLWEALAGRSLFQADTEAVTLSRVVSGPIPAVRSFVPDLPASLDEVCRRALHRDRNKRFRTAAEMADALEQAAGAEGFAGVASPRELGRFVEATLGAQLTAQREAVRAALAPASQRLSSVPSLAATSSGRPATPEVSPASAAAPPASSSAPPASAAAPPASAARDQAVAAPAEAAPSSARASMGETPKATPQASPAPPPVGEAPAEPERAAEVSPASAAAPAPTAPAAPPAAPAPSIQAPAGLAALLKRVTASKVSAPRGVALAVLLVIILTAPIWIRLTNRVLGRGAGKPVAAAPDEPSRPPAPPPTATSLAEPPPLPAQPPRKVSGPTQPAWDEGDWLPEAGAPAPAPR